MANRWLLLTWRRVLVILVAWVLAVVLHNAVYALFHESFGPGGDEPFFFLLAVIVIPAWFLASLLYSCAWWLRRRR